MLKYLLLLISISLAALVQAQELSKIDLKNVPIDEYTIRVSEAKSMITLDGDLSDPDWQNADVIKNFYQNYPYDTGYALSPTEVKMTYDKRCLYLAFICYDKISGKYIASNMGRDWSHRDTDGIQWVIDAFNDKTNGLCFGISPYNAQRDGLVTNGGADAINTAWDNKWYSETKVFEDYWVAEVAIPFSTLRFKSGLPEWRINFTRVDYKRNEMSTWVPLFRNFSVASLAYTGRIIWDKPLEGRSNSVSLIPYVTGRVQNDRENPSNTNATFTGGIEAKVPISSNLNLDLTVNPDFSQADVDQQVTNLTRFELTFPERRNFFLENADLFTGFGSARVRPFFSRRIGIYQNPTTRLYEQIPIWFGARVSGKTNKNWRIGALNSITPNNQSLGLTGQTYTMMSVQRLLFTRSNIGAFLVNRQSLGKVNEFNLNPDNKDHNTVAGLEFNLSSKDNRWNGKAYWHQSFDSQNKRPQNYSWNADIGYDDRHWSIGLAQQAVGNNFKADVGFVQRTNFYRNEADIGYTFLPEKGIIASHGPHIATRQIINYGQGIGDNDQEFYWYFGFKNTASARVYANSNYVKLFAPFDPGGKGRTTDERYALATGTEYYMQTYGMAFSSNISKPFFYSATAYSGDFYNGSIYHLGFNANYRLLPYVLFTLNGSSDYVRLPSTWGNTRYDLLGAGINATFTNNLFFRVNYQYNQQANNVNLNARLQWRFKPVSDFFLVYTDNYLADSYKYRNRTIIAKLTYWFNT